jgi:hypothetical protein
VCLRSYYTRKAEIERLWFQDTTGKSKLRPYFRKARTVVAGVGGMRGKGNGEDDQW